MYQLCQVVATNCHVYTPPSPGLAVSAGALHGRRRGGRAAAAAAPAAGRGRGPRLRRLCLVLLLRLVWLAPEDICLGVLLTKWQG